VPAKATEYDYEASSYDKSRFESSLGRHLDRMQKRIVASLLSSTGGVLLDLGVGTGRFALWLEGEGFEVVGADISRRMLLEAKTKAVNASKSIHLVLADVHFLPFREGIFDGCTCVNMANHIVGIDRFLEEVKHAMKISGSLVVNFPNLRSLYLPIAIIVNLRKRALFKGGIRSRWFTPTEIGVLMSKAGFSIQDVRGCALATSLPLGDKLAKFVQMMNFSIEDSRLKLFSGNLFVKATIKACES